MVVWFVLIFVLFVLIMDFILLSIFSSMVYILPGAILLIGFCGAIIYRITTKESKSQGFDIGVGEDIDNPDRPKSVRVTLNLLLGFIAIGGPGSGKSNFCVSVLKYFTRVRELGWVLFEGKGELETYQLTVASGANPTKFFSIELTNSDTVNLVEGDSDEIIEAITQALITTNNPYYEYNQREAIGVIVPLLKATGKRITMKDIYTALKVDDAALYALKLAKDANADTSIIDFAKDYLASDQKKRLENAKGLLTKMGFLVTGRLANRVNDYYPTLDFSEASKNHERIYLHLPYSALAKDVAIFFTEILGGIARRRQYTNAKHNIWPMLFDDWGKFFYNNIGAITARCRTALMPFSYSFQSVGQVDAVDPNFRVELSDNVAEKYFFRVNGPETAAWASKQFGQYECRSLSANGEMIYEKRPRVPGEEFESLNAGQGYMRCLEPRPNGEFIIHRVKVRTPRAVESNKPSEVDTKSIDWPVIEINTKHIDNETCLNLWDTFLSGDQGKRLKKEIEDDVRKKMDEVDKQQKESLPI